MPYNFAWHKVWVDENGTVVSLHAEEGLADAQLFDDGEFRISTFKSTAPRTVLHRQRWEELTCERARDACAGCMPQCLASNPQQETSSEAMEIATLLTPGKRGEEGREMPELEPSGICDTRVAMGKAAWI